MRAWLKAKTPVPRMVVGGAFAGWWSSFTWQPVVMRALEAVAAIVLIGWWLVADMAEVWRSRRASR